MTLRGVGDVGRDFRLHGGVKGVWLSRSSVLACSGVGRTRVLAYIFIFMGARAHGLFIVFYTYIMAYIIMRLLNKSKQSTPLAELRNPTLYAGPGQHECVDRFDSLRLVITIIKVRKLLTITMTVAGVFHRIYLPALRAQTPTGDFLLLGFFNQCQLPRHVSTATFISPSSTASVPESHHRAKSRVSLSKEQQRFLDSAVSRLQASPSLPTIKLH